MSSNNSFSLSTNISHLTLLDEINSLIKLNKTIIPFNKEHFSCQSLLLAKNIVYLDFANYNAIEEYSSQDQIITVQTGIKIKTLQNFLLKEGKWFPVAYYDDKTSLLDLILSAELGPAEQLLGGLSRHVLGLNSILGTGQLIKSGGKVVKNVSGYDLTRFFIGSYGYFALPIRAHLRLYSLPCRQLTFLIQGDDWQQLLALAKQISNSNASLACIELLNQRLAKISILAEKYKLQKQFVLAVATYAYDATVDRTTEMIKNSRLEKDLFYSVIEDAADQACIFQELSQISWFTNKVPFAKEKKCKIMDLSIKMSDLTELLGQDKISAFPFVYKVTSNKMRFCLDSIAEQSMLLKHLADFAQLNNKILPLAYGDDTCIRRAYNLGYDTNNGDQLLTIKKQLKTAFDPHNLFNPYVDL